MADRSELGEEKIGEPIWDVRHAVNILSHTEFEEARLDAIDYYIETFLMDFVPGVVDEALSDEQLEKLDPETMKQVAFLLVGNAIVELRERLVSPEMFQSDPKWHEQLIRRIAKLLALHEGPFIDQILSPSPEDITTDPLIAKLSEEMGMELAKFFIVQPAMIENVIEDVLDPKD